MHPLPTPKASHSLPCAGHLLSCFWCPYGGEADFLTPLSPNTLFRKMGYKYFSGLFYRTVGTTRGLMLKITHAEGLIFSRVGIPGVRAVGALRGFLRQKGRGKVPLPPSLSRSPLKPSKRVSLLSGVDREPPLCPLSDWLSPARGSAATGPWARQSGPPGSAPPLPGVYNGNSHGPGSGVQPAAAAARPSRATERRAQSTRSRSSSLPGGS